MPAGNWPLFSAAFKSIAALLFIGCLAWFGWVYVQTRQHAIVTPLAYSSPKPLKPDSFAAQPRRRTPTSEYTPWKDLTKEEQQILAPLALTWDHLSRYQHRSLLHSVKQYPRMSKEQQARFTSRLVQWTRLTKEQRKVIRKRYAELASLPKEQKEKLRNQWLAQHSPSERVGPVQ